MAQILGYCTVNGGSAKNYQLTKEVINQSEIEGLRKELEEKHNREIECHMFGEDYNSYKDISP